MFHCFAMYLRLAMIEMNHVESTEIALPPGSTKVGAALITMDSWIR